MPIKVLQKHTAPRLDRIPTRCNLLTRGVEVEYSLCPVCGLMPEDVNHILFKCDLAVSVFRRICHSIDEPITTPEIRTENVAPASEEAAGVVALAETAAAVESATMTKTEVFFTMHIFRGNCFFIVKKSIIKVCKASVNEWKIYGVAL
nr:RNA-directed DNA polymerase, eukaryota, reverse transcriptase zinc-binding domain protein [Tanacetum cinerariifolium]